MKKWREIRVSFRNERQVLWIYLKYLLKHKYLVFKECWRAGLYLHALTHDLSKFLPSEFYYYAWKFCSGDYAFRYLEVEAGFKSAWFNHYKRNKHHWNYWTSWSGWAEQMPIKYIKQMICDWDAMSIKFGSTTKKFFEKEGPKMNLHTNTRRDINILLKDNIKKKRRARK